MCSDCLITNSAGGNINNFEKILIMGSEYAKLFSFDEQVSDIIIDKDGSLTSKKQLTFVTGFQPHF